MRKRKLIFTVLLLTIALSALSDTNMEPIRKPAPPTNEFHFSRLIYKASYYGRWWSGSRWMTDAPAAEHHLMQGLHRLIQVDMAQVSGEDGAGSRTINLHDDSVFDFPWLYAVEVGSWTLDNVEAKKLREYLERGGFLVVDDFHGTLQWARFIKTLKQVFPDRPVVDIPNKDVIMHILYDVDEKTQIPGTYALSMGQTYEQDGYNPHWRGIYDDKGRLMVVINFNMDMGDAWEHADDPDYPEHYTSLAYRFAANYVVYDMTH